MSSGRLHRGSTVVFSAIIAVLGLLILIQTVLAGGGPIARGTVLGLMLLALGVFRLALALRRSPS